MSGRADMRNGRATDPYQSLLEVSPSQALAIDALDAGLTHQAAAEAAGVNRVTVTRWVHHHPAFQAELNRRRLERRESLAAQAEGISARAMTLVDDAIRGGDLAAAIAWIRMSFAPSRSPRTTGTEAAPLVTPQSIIERAAEMAALREPLQILNNAYRGTAVAEIQSALNEGSNAAE